MRRATEHHRSGTWPAAKAVGTVTLALDDRHRRRIRMAVDGGAAFLLDLPQAVMLCDGDGLEISEGGYIRVIAADEPVADVRAKSASHTARLAWHIGNRHVAVQVLENGDLRILDDHVLVQMLEGLGAEVVRHNAPFSPEPGAYEKAEKDHSHDH
ncbi:MAG: urease accessory protein UreE [Rhodospirillales bacterium]|nr:urease accessory protein UreE [Rhodospirillales bacterium]